VELSGFAFIVGFYFICIPNLRSIVDTSRKRGLNEFKALRDMIAGISAFLL